MEVAKTGGSTEIVHVLPAQGHETQLLYWFRVCVAEWSNGVDPRRGVTTEEFLIWDKGRQAYVLESHQYGAEVNHRCQRAVMDEAAMRGWIDRRTPELLWRDDAIASYPGFVRPVPRVASNDVPVPERV